MQINRVEFIIYCVCVTAVLSTYMQELLRGQVGVVSGSVVVSLPDVHQSQLLTVATLSTTTNKQITIQKS